MERHQRLRKQHRVQKSLQQTKVASKCFSNAVEEGDALSFSAKSLFYSQEAV